jgi:RsiW-degrading membrane proteinase PrsW (M82 family)
MAHTLMGSTCKVVTNCRQAIALSWVKMGHNSSLSASSTPKPYSPLFTTPVPTNFTTATGTPVTPVGAGGHPKPDSVTFTQLFPLASTGRDLTQKAFLGPGILTVVFVVLMFAAVGQPVVFNLLLAAYLAGAASFFVYRLCGKSKPWWVLLVVLSTG